MALIKNVPERGLVKSPKLLNSGQSSEVVLLNEAHEIPFVADLDMLDHLDKRLSDSEAAAIALSLFLQIPSSSPPAESPWILSARLNSLRGL